MNIIEAKYVALLEEKIKDLQEQNELLTRLSSAISVDSYKIDCKNADIEYPIVTSPDPVILHDVFMWHCPCGWKNIERQIPMELKSDELEMMAEIMDGTPVVTGKPETVCCSYCGEVRPVAVDWSLMSDYYDEELVDEDDDEQVS